MYYVLVVCDDDEDVEFLRQAFHAQPGNISFYSVNGGVKLLEFMSNQPLNELPFLKENRYDSRRTQTRRTRIFDRHDLY